MNSRQKFSLLLGLALIVLGVWAKFIWVIYVVILPVLLAFASPNNQSVTKRAIANYGFIFLIIGCVGVFTAALTYLRDVPDQNPVELLKFGLVFLIPGVLLLFGVRSFNQRTRKYL